MIVFDTSSLVSATIRRGSVPDRAVRHALQNDTLALSDEVMAELLEVLHRPRLARFVDPGQRMALLGLLETLAVVFTPTTPVIDCRDVKDNKYLELALVSLAAIIVSSDSDLLVLHPWRGVRILLPGEYLATV